MKILSILFLTLGLAVMQAQTATPNTTFCAAVTATATSVCLASTTSVVNQTGLYADGEFMLVQLSNSQVLAAGPTYVPVSRGNRAGATPPIAHVNGAIVWKALTPSASVVPGSNGFVYSTQLGDMGACTRASITYLPHIWPDRNVKRDCTTTGVWVDYAPASGLDNTSPSPVSLLATSQALSVSSGNYVITKPSVLAALTLGAPTAGVQDGMVIVIKSASAFAHTLTATALIQTGGSASPYTTATFGVTSAFIGATLTLQSYGGFWYVVASSNVAFT